MTTSSYVQQKSYTTRGLLFYYKQNKESPYKGVYSLIVERSSEVIGGTRDDDAPLPLGRPRGTMAVLIIRGCVLMTIGRALLGTGCTDSGTGAGSGSASEGSPSSIGSSLGSSSSSESTSKCMTGEGGAGGAPNSSRSAPIKLDQDVVRGSAPRSRHHMDG